MTEYVLWDAAYGMEVSRRYTNLDDLRKAVYGFVQRNGKRTHIVSRFEVVSVRYTKSGRPDYTGRGHMDSVGKTVYYTVWNDSRPTDRVSVVLPSGKLKSNAKSKKTVPAPFGL